MKRHSRLIVPLLLLALPIALHAEPQKETKKQRPYKQYAIEQFMTSVNISGASFSPDEKEIMYTSNETGIPNAYTVSVTGGAAKALTTSTTDSTYGVSYFPKDKRILYTRDQGGNENNHLYVRELDGSEKDLTPGEKVKAMFGGWSKDKASFYVLVNDRDPRFFDIWEYETDGYEKTLVYKDETGLQFGGISSDGRWIAFVKPSGTADSDIYLYEAQKKELKNITAHEGRIASNDASDFDPASKYLYYLTNDGGEFTRALRYELATGKAEEVEKADWDIMYTVFSENGKYRVTGINQDASTVIRLYDGTTNKALPLPKLPNGDISTVSVSPSEKLMAFYMVSDRAPRNLYVYDFAAQKATKLSDTLSKEIDPEDLVESTVARFKSFDKMEIPGILYKPHQATPDAKVPAIVMVHGGPGGQAREGYNSLAQFLANHGYVVYDINNRGSSGYGKTFFMADDKKHGREPLWDCVEAKTFLTSLPYVDGSKVGIMGGSYGGYMVGAALAFKPEVFDVGIDIFGVMNWIRTLESIPPYWESFRKSLYEEIGDPVKDLEMLKAASPLLHADKIRKPLLVVQGANDPRVIKPESDDIVAAVKKNGVPVEYLVFDDEGHGFSKKKNQIAAYGKILGFLDTHLKNKK
jgi:dipeptidyl aminopeptidase/acylaminoacyl peptidase